MAEQLSRYTMGSTSSEELSQVRCCQGKLSADLTTPREIAY